MAAANVNYDATILAPLTTTERYEHAMGLIHIFETIGLGNSQRVRLIDDGLSTIQDLIHQYGYDIKSFSSYLQNLNKTFATSAAATRVYYSPPEISQLCGGLFYFNHCVNSLHIVPDVLQVDSDFLQDNYDHYKQLIADQDNDDDDAEDIDLPKLKGHENWVQWRDAFIAHLGMTIGSRGISLDYVVNQNARNATHGNATREEYETVDLEDDDIFTNRAIHFGIGYKSDNSKIWKRLKSALINTPPYNHISHWNLAKNGRRAWGALLSAYEGTDFSERMRDSAFATLKQAHYRGEAKNFGWEKYVEIHKAAHKKLTDAGYNSGRGMDEETKVQHLKANIRAEAGLENALLLSRSNNLHRYDFDSFVSFISTEVNDRLDRLKQLKNSDRSVAKIQHNNANYKHKGESYKPDAEQWKTRPSRFVDGKKVYGAKYPPKRFKLLTKNQKQAVIEVKREWWSTQDKSSGKGHASGKGNAMVKAMTAVQEDMTSLETRLISAVQRASSEQGDDAATRVSFDDNTTVSKRKAADSGSIGTFLSQQRKQKKGD